MLLTKKIAGSCHDQLGLLLWTRTISIRLVSKHIRSLIRPLETLNIKISFKFNAN